MKRASVTGCFMVIAAGVFWSGVLAAQAKETTIAVSRQDDKTILVKSGERQILEYRCRESPNKPYVRQLFTPGGVQVLRDSPSDHKHHHALMFAVEADKIDFWGEQPNAGIEKSLAVESLKSNVRAGIGRAGFLQRLNWIDPQTGKPLLQEVRRIETFAAPELEAALLSWHTALEPAAGKGTVTLDGHHYYGLGMRFVTSMDEEGEFLYSDKKDSESVRGSEKLTPARWCAYRSKAEGKPVTVAMFDSPKNPRHPNKFFTMRPFAYMSATLNLWKEPMTLKAGEPLDLTYGVAVWDGHVEPAEIEKTYQWWLKLEQENK
jgi:hypothetical protein